MASHGVAGKLGSLQPRIDLVATTRNSVAGVAWIAETSTGVNSRPASTKAWSASTRFARNASRNASSVMSRPIRTSTLRCATPPAFRDHQEAIATPPPVRERATCKQLTMRGLAHTPFARAVHRAVDNLPGDRQVVDGDRQCVDALFETVALEADVELGARQPQLPRLARCRPSKRPTLESKELGFKQVLGQRRAIEGHKRAITTR